MLEGFLILVAIGLTLGGGFVAGRVFEESPGLAVTTSLFCGVVITPAVYLVTLATRWGDLDDTASFFWLMCWWLCWWIARKFADAYEE